MDSVDLWVVVKYGVVAMFIDRSFPTTVAILWKSQIAQIDDLFTACLKRIDSMKAQVVV